MYNKLVVKYQNVRGLRTKVNQFYLSVLQCTSDVVILTETWLNNSVNNAELFGTNYLCHRADRQEKSRGGGVLIAVNNDWNSVNLTKYYIFPLSNIYW